MGLFDAILLLILLFSSIIGVFRGVAKEILSLIGLISAIYISFKFSGVVADEYIDHFLDQEKISYVVAFGLIFVSTLFTFALVNLIISHILKLTGLSILNRFLGLVFGLLRGTLFCSIIVGITSAFGLSSMEWRKNSSLAPFFEKTYSLMLSIIPNNTKDDVGHWTNQLKINTNGEQLVSTNTVKLLLETATNTISSEEPVLKEKKSQVERPKDSVIEKQTNNNPLINLESVD